MDEKSTPIASLNNNQDDSTVVNQILSKYNNLEDGQTNMENKFENRDLNNEMYNIKADNVQYNDHYQKELQRSSQYTNENNGNKEIIDQNENTYDDDDDYDEYEVIEIPLWKKIINEIRIPIFIFIFILCISNCTFDKLLITKIPFLGNNFNECNTYGILLKALLISILSYIFIRFIKL